MASKKTTKTNTKKKLAKKTVKKTTKKPAAKKTSKKQVIKKTAKKKTVKKPAKKTTKKKAVKKPAKKTTKKKAVKKPAKKTTKKKVVKKPAKKTTKNKVVKKPAKKTSQKKVVKKPTEKASKSGMPKKATAARSGKAKPKKTIKKPSSTAQKGVAENSVIRQTGRQDKTRPEAAKQKNRNQALTKKTKGTETPMKKHKNQPAASQQPPVTLKKESLAVIQETPIQDETAFNPNMEVKQTVPGLTDIQPYPLDKNETYMCDAQKEHFAKILKAWQDQLISEIDQTKNHMQTEKIACPDPVDRASLEEGFNLELRTRDRERRLLKKITQAISLLASDDYGFCEDCGVEIGIRRLEARPTATKCIDCKTVQEIREKQTGK